MTCAAIPTGITTDINHHHRLASLSAAEAIKHAKLAGELLLRVKAELKHGEWLPWLAANVEVSERQAQRYMRAASGKPLLALKSDTVSDLGTLIPHDFEPVPGRWMLAKCGDRAYSIEPALDHPDHYFLACIWLIGDDDAGSWCLASPVHRAAVEMVLKSEGLEDPSAVAWYMHKSNGVRSALEVPA